MQLPARPGTLQKSGSDLADQMLAVEKLLGTSLAGLTGLTSQSSWSEICERAPSRLRIYETALSVMRENPPALPSIEFGLLQRRLEMLNSLQKSMHASDGTDRPLRDYQLPVFEKLASFLESGKDSGYVALPTGTGKTVLFAKFAAALNGKTLIVVPTKELISQTVKELAVSAPGRNVGIIGGDNSTGFGEDITVITYKSFLDLSKSGDIERQEFDLVILDEAHKALGEKTSEEVQRLLGRSIVLGFTATPEYSEEKNLLALLKNEIYRMEVAEAIELGALCETRVIGVRSKLSLEDVGTSAGEYNLGQLSRKLSTPQQNRAVAETYTRLFNGEKALAFCADVTHAERQAEMFVSLVGIAAEAISSYDTKDERRRKIVDFRSGKIKILCNADLLTHGFDDVQVSVCLNCTPTLSTVSATQRGGRVLRLDPNNPLKVAYIVEFLFEDRPRQRMPVTFDRIMGGVHKRSLVGGSHDFKPSPLDDFPSDALQDLGLELFILENSLESILTARRLAAAAEAPPGWKTTADLVIELGQPYSNIRSRLLALGSGHSDWFGTFRYSGSIERSRGRLIEHYHPDLINLVREDLTGPRTDEYADWFRIEHFCGLANLNAQAVQDRFIKKYTEQNSSWLRIRQGATLYSPELEAIVREDIARARAGVPNSMIDVRDLPRRLGVDASSAKYFIDLLIPDHPSWEQWYHAGTSYRRYYSSELIDVASKIVNRWREQEQQYPLLPGWIKLESILRLDSNGKPVPVYDLESSIKVRLIDEIRMTMPEEIGIHCRQGSQYEILSPRAQSCLLEQRTYRKLLADGWRPLETVLMDLPSMLHEHAKEVMSKLPGLTCTVTIDGKQVTMVQNELISYIVRS